MIDKLHSVTLNAVMNHMLSSFFQLKKKSLLTTSDFAKMLHRNGSSVDRTCLSVCNVIHRLWNMKINANKIYGKSQNLEIVLRFITTVTEPYIILYLKRRQRSHSALRRTSTLPLAVEVCRFKGTSEHLSLCEFCNLQVVED